MKLDVADPVSGVRRGGTAQMAFRTGWSASPGLRCPGKIRAVAGLRGAAGRPVQPCVVSMEGVGVISPLDGMNRFRVAKMTLGAGDPRNAAEIISPMTFGTGFRVGQRLGLVAVRQPAGRVLPGRGIEVGLGIRIPASGQQKEGKQRQQERRQESFSYLWHALHLSLFPRPWHFRQEAGLILPSILCRLR
jgi:hypothetical protein